MANTYTQIYVQIVLAVQGRQSLIRPQHSDQLQKCITGIISAQEQKLIAINNMPSPYTTSASSSAWTLNCRS